MKGKYIILVSLVALVLFGMLACQVVKRWDVGIGN